MQHFGWLVGWLVFFSFYLNSWFLVEVGLLTTDISIMMVALQGRWAWLQFWGKSPILAHSQLLWLGAHKCEMGHSRAWQWGLSSLLHCSPFLKPEKILSLAGHHCHRASACSSSGTQSGQTKDKLEQGPAQRPRPLKVDSGKTRNRITVKWHPNKETKDLEWILMTHRGRRGWGDKDSDCYQLLEGTSQPHLRLSHGCPEGRGFPSILS